MVNPLTGYLERLTPLTTGCRQMLDGAVTTTRSHAAGTVVAHAGERVSGGKVVLEGICCQRQTLLNGRRQIVSVLFPGDAPELLLPADHRRRFDLVAIDDCVVASLSTAVVTGLKASDEIMRGLVAAKQIEVDTALNWIFNFSGRPTDVGLAHLLCELRYRMSRSVPQYEPAGTTPFNQTHLAEMIGKTHVHLNRTLQNLRSQGLLGGTGSRLFAFDPARLAAFCDFDPSYLQPSGGVA